MYEDNYFINRELSWLEFNNRVLDEAKKSDNPLIERARFLAITSTNLDEFYMIRVASLIAQVEENYKKKDIAGFTPKEQLETISIVVKKFIKEQDKIYEELIEKFEEQDIFFEKLNNLNKEDYENIKEFFENTIFPVLNPLIIKVEDSFPYLANKSLNVIVKLEKDQEYIAIIQVPSMLERLKIIENNNNKKIILLENIIIEFLNKIFPEHKILSKGVFKLTRNADMIIDEDDAEDLLIKIENSIQKRKWGNPVRVEVNKEMPNSLLEFLNLNLNKKYLELIRYKSPLCFSFLLELFKIKNHEKLKYKKIYPKMHPKIETEDNIWKAIKKGDILLHHPYESFSYIVNMIEDAAEDEKVLVIKQTLYRVSGNSPIINSLIKAVKNGKKVTVLVELKARFDEKRNIMWAKQLEDAGCHVIYGLKGLKTHCKCLLIMRKELDKIIKYVHLGTGNYNDSTAKHYTDLSLLSSNEKLCIDVNNLFNKLTGYPDINNWYKLKISPDYLRDFFYKSIDNEIKIVKNKGEGIIIAKMNSLVDKGIINKLYEASQAGVKIKLIVRGACCLRPKLKGISDNIEIFSLVGRFLEHTRIFIFGNNNDEKIYLSSADWMTRNLNHRIEILFPIEQKDIKEKVKKIIKYNMKDNVNLRKIITNGSYINIEKKNINFNAHLEFFKPILHNYI